jgi:hypothetical protein
MAHETRKSIESNLKPPPSIVLFASLKEAEKYCSLIYCEKNIISSLKKYGFKDKRTGPLCATIVILSMGTVN